MDGEEAWCAKAPAPIASTTTARATGGLIPASSFGALDYAAVAATVKHGGGPPRQWARASSGCPTSIRPGGIQPNRTLAAQWRMRTMQSQRGRALRCFAILLVAILGAARVDAQTITAAGEPAQLDVRAAGERSIRITLKPVSFKEAFPVNPAVVARSVCVSSALAAESHAAGAQDGRRALRRSSAQPADAAHHEPTPAPWSRSSSSRAMARSRSGSTSTPCSAWAKAVRCRRKTGRGVSSRCSSIAADGSTRCSRAGRPTCTARGTRSRCCSARAAGACSSRRRGDRSISASPTAASSSPGDPATPNACRRTSATSSRRWRRACRHRTPSSPGCSTSSSSTPPIRPRR